MRSVRRWLPTLVLVGALLGSAPAHGQHQAAPAPESPSPAAPQAQEAEEDEVPAEVQAVASQVDALWTEAGQLAAAGHYLEAAERYEAALTRLGDIADHVSGETFYSLNFEAGSMWLYAGHYDRSQTRLYQAIELASSVYGPASNELYQTYAMLTNLLVSMGNFEQAEAGYNVMLQHAERARGKESVEVASIVCGLAQLATFQGDMDLALERYESAMPKLEAELGPEHPSVLTFLGGLSSVYDHKKQYEKSLAASRRILKARKKLLGERSPPTANAMNNVANALLRVGKLKEARRLAEEAVAIDEETLGSFHIATGNHSYTLAYILVAMGKLDDAVPLARRWAENNQLLMKSAEAATTESRFESFLALWTRQESAAFGLAHHAPHHRGAVELAMASALLKKGRSIDGAMHLAQAMAGGFNAEGQKVLAGLRDLRSQLSELALEGPGDKGTTAWLGRIKDLELEAEWHERQLADASAAFRARDLPAVGEVVQVVAKRIPEGAALIDYVAFMPTYYGAKGDEPQWGPWTYAALVLTSDAKPMFLPVGPTEDIDALIGGHRDWVTDPETDEDDTSSAEALEAAVLGPVLKALAAKGSYRKLLVAPEGELNLVPWAALHNGTSYLLDRATITVLGSGRDLLREAVSPSATIRILADPDFSGLSEPAPGGEGAGLGIPGAPSLSRSGLAALPGTRAEAESLKQIFPGAKALFGKGADEHSLLSMEAPGVLHVATHGVFVPDAAEEQGMPPLARSALVLSHEEGQGDGFATAMEITGMNLWGTQLVTLSACDTGRGSVKIGQGVYGLRRAMQVAGAETVVTSLWKVDDVITQMLMSRFYRGLKNGRGRAEAMRSASKAVRRVHGHPNAWAPFIVIGRDGPLRGIGGAAPKGGSGDGG